MHDTDDITLTFRPLPDDVPVSVRVRHLLKYALRAQRLRCVAMVGVPTVPAATPQPAPETRSADEAG
jgi:hypothetical protein